MPPSFNFVDEVPPTQGRSYIDPDRAQKTIDALADYPNKWAQIPVTYLYPDLEGSTEAKLKTKARSVAGRLQRGDLKPFSEYRIEGKSRGTDLYMRLVMTKREMREAGYELED